MRGGPEIRSLVGRFTRLSIVANVWCMALQGKGIARHCPHVSKSGRGQVLLPGQSRVVPCDARPLPASPFRLAKAELAPPRASHIPAQEKIEKDHAVKAQDPPARHDSHYGELPFIEGDSESHETSAGVSSVGYDGLGVQSAAFGEIPSRDESAGGVSPKGRVKEKMLVESGAHIAGPLHGLPIALLQLSTR